MGSQDEKFGSDSSDAFPSYVESASGPISIESAPIPFLQGQARTTMDWTPDVEQILTHWSEEARCLQWMHLHAFRTYRLRYRQLIIPIIILSSLTGFCNIGVSTFVPQTGQP